jgi:oligopeptide transport system substrate-binding protein
VGMLREDAPWVWGFHPKDYSLVHQWLSNVKPSNLGRGGLKFYRIDARLREQKQLAWNRPVVWPLVALLILLAASAIPAYRSYRRRELSAAR